VTISFFAPGDPKGQPRPRAFSRGGHARVFDPGTAEGWKSAVAVAAKPHIPAQPIAGAVYVTLDFYFRRPKSHYRTGKRAGELRDDAPEVFLSKPDADNLAKAVLDAMTTIGFWKDDAQVWNLSVSKRYDRDGRPGVCVEVISSK
jgi:Holliday junction resolvase RusA-like endonuclease